MTGELRDGVNFANAQALIQRLAKQLVQHDAVLLSEESPL